MPLSSTSRLSVLRSHPVMSVVARGMWREGEGAVYTKGLRSAFVGGRNIMVE